MIKVSFIIPMYNAEKYIGNCLRSILDQGLNEDEYEVIVINDGSTDDGPKIVHSFTETHAHFRMVSQDNSGISAARNNGLALAQGQYIHWIDADDMLAKVRGVKRVLEIACQGNFDAVRCNSITIDNHTKIPREGKEEINILYKGAALDKFKNDGFSTFVWNTLYNREFLIKNHLAFKAFAMGEDDLFNIEVLRCNPNVCCTDALIYLYFLRKGSAVNNVDRKHLKRIIDGYLELSKTLYVYRKTDSQLSVLYQKRLARWRQLTFTRLLSGAFSYRETKCIVSKIQSVVEFPANRGRIDSIIRFSFRYPVVMYLASPLFRYLFLPFIKPLIKRN